MKKANIISAVLGMALSAGAFVMTLSFKKFKTVPVGPEFFPRFLAAGLFLCCAALLIQAFFYNKKKEEKAPTLSLKDPGMRRLLIGAGIIVVYALLWEPVGFILATPLVIFALMFLLGLRKYPTMAIASVAATAVVFSAFKFLLGIDMPLGILDGLF